MMNPVVIPAYSDICKMAVDALIDFLGEATKSAIDNDAPSDFVDGMEHAIDLLDLVSRGLETVRQEGDGFSEAAEVDGEG